MHGETVKFVLNCLRDYKQKYNINIETFVASY